MPSFGLTSRSGNENAVFFAEISVPEPDASGAPVSGPRQRSQQQRRVEARERLVEAAISCIDQRGYHGATLQQIAADAGLSKANALYHFASRAQLMAAVAERVYQRTRSAITAAIAARPAGDSITEAFAREAWEQFKLPENMAILEILIASRSDPELLAAVTPAMEGSYADAQVFYQGMLEADTSPWATHGAMHFTLGLALLRGLMLERHLSGDPRVDEAASYWIDIFTKSTHTPSAAVGGSGE
jgi:AcrR family transcriptional regulator